jgi:hypothetical protein
MVSCSRSNYHVSLDRIVPNDPPSLAAIAQAANVVPNSVVAGWSRIRHDELHDMNWLMGGVCYTNCYGQESMQIHQAGFMPRWANRDLLWVAFHYPFCQIGVKRLFGVVRADNDAAIKLNSNLGFITVAEVKGVYENGASQLIMKMEADECRFLNIKPRLIKFNPH